MKLALPDGISAIEISATAGEQIKVSALLGDKQVDKYLTADLSKHPNRKDKWIAPAVAIASQASDPTIGNYFEDWNRPTVPDTRNVWDRIAVAEAGVADLNSQVEYWRKAAQTSVNCNPFFDAPFAEVQPNRIVDSLISTVERVENASNESNGNNTKSL